jgi:endonuclease/exonuclease/phosphatase family metal-dependent hydrolase
MSSRSARPSAPATRLAASTGAQRGAVATLHVATWNLRHGRGPHGGVDLGAVAARIAAMDADVVAVQEVDRRQRRSGNADQIGELAHRLGWHGQFAATIVAGAREMRAAVTHDDDDGGPAYGIGLLSRHPLNAPTTLVLPPANAHEPRVLLRAAVSTAAGDVGVGVTHLSWKPWQAWQQLRSVLASAGDSHRPAVLAGDLNLPYGLLAVAADNTGWCAVRACATFPAQRPVLQLDHILIRGGHPIDVRVGPADTSDHRALRAAIVIDDHRPTPNRR